MVLNDFFPAKTTAPEPHLAPHSGEGHSRFSHVLSRTRLIRKSVVVSAGGLVVVGQWHLPLALRRKGVYNAYPPRGFTTAGNDTHVDLRPEAKVPLGQGVIASGKAIVTYQVGDKPCVAVTSGAPTRF